MIYSSSKLPPKFFMRSDIEDEPKGLETQFQEPLTINQVLESVYEKLVASFEGIPVIRQFADEFSRWDSFHDINGTRDIHFHLSGILYEIEKDKGLLIVKSGERGPSWFSSLVKVVAWTRLEIGGDGKYKVQIRDYPSWDELPTERMIPELPKDHSERSFRKGGLLTNQGQRLVLNGVIPMQPGFVAQKEAVSLEVVRGPGGVPILLGESRRKTDEMYADDLVTSGTLYKPEIIPWLVSQIRRDFTRKPKDN